MLTRISVVLKIIPFSFEAERAVLRRPFLKYSLWFVPQSVQYLVRVVLGSRRSENVVEEDVVEGLEQGKHTSILLREAFDCVSH